jgi:hypothetical protein
MVIDRLEYKLLSDGLTSEAALARAEILVATIDKYVKHNQGTFVYFAFEENNYLTFAAWLEQTLAYIKEQNAIIAYYEQIAKQRNITPNKQDTTND